MTSRKQPTTLATTAPNDMVVSDILRPNELQSWFIGQHLVEMPLILTK